MIRASRKAAPESTWNHGVKKKSKDETVPENRRGQKEGIIYVTELYRN
jgi:hypothetical protein